MANCNECKRQNNCPGLDHCVHDSPELLELRKDAERYRKWRADYTNHANTPISEMPLAISAAWTPEDVDAAIDAVSAVGAA